LRFFRATTRSASSIALLNLIWVGVGIGCRGEGADPGAASSPPPTTAATAALAAPASGAVVSGQAAPAYGGFPAVVSLEPETASSAGASPTLEPFMDQLGKAFYPPTLLVRSGETVAFSNSDPDMHNVDVAHDETQVALFNVATPPGFAPYRHTFSERGVYRVTCSIHPGMSAFVVVVTTPHAAVAERDGRFSIAGVPPGRYRAVVWSLDSARHVERTVEVAAGAASLELDLSRP
jgi:plastocyanin